MLQQIERVCNAGEACLSSPVVVRKCAVVDWDAAEHYGRLAFCMSAVQLERFWQEAYVTTILAFLTTMKAWALSRGKGGEGTVSLMADTLGFLEVWLPISEPVMCL
jgi:hypothetical protein